MIKIICNNIDCQTEIDSQKYFAELVVRKTEIISVPKKGQFLMPQQQIAEKKYHFCEPCLDKLLKEAKV